MKWLSPLEFFVKQEVHFAKAASIGQWLLDESEESKEWAAGPHRWSLNLFGPLVLDDFVVEPRTLHP